MYTKYVRGRSRIAICYSNTRGRCHRVGDNTVVSVLCIMSKRVSIEFCTRKHDKSNPTVVCYHCIIKKDLLPI